MNNSMELLQKALEIKTISEWGRVFNIVPSTITNARARGRLGAALAGNFAIELGESPERWIAIAAMEAETKSPLTERLRAFQEKWRKLWLSYGSRWRFRGRKAPSSDESSSKQCELKEKAKK